MIPISEIGKNKALKHTWLTWDAGGTGAGNIVLFDMEIYPTNHPMPPLKEGPDITWQGLSSHLWLVSGQSKLSFRLESTSIKGLPWLCLSPPPRPPPCCLPQIPVLLPLSCPATLTPQVPENPHRSRGVATEMLPVDSRHRACGHQISAEVTGARGK